MHNDIFSCISHYTLIFQVNGIEPPQTLPPEMIPPSMRVAGLVVPVTTAVEEVKKVRMFRGL